MKKLAVCAMMCVMGSVACGEPEAQVIYHKGQEPEVIPRGTVVGPGGGVVDQGGMMPDPNPNPNPNPNPGTGGWPVTPDMLGASTPISTTPCDLDEASNLLSSEGSVFFSDGVLRCQSPGIETLLLFGWGHKTTTDVYVRIGGESVQWMIVPGTTGNPDDASPYHVTDQIRVPPDTIVDLYIQDHVRLDDLLVGFDDPAEAELGG